MPVTVPEEEPIVAIALLLLVQIPPGVPLVSVVLVDVHRFDDPLTAPGDRNTVTTLDEKHPVGIV